MLQRGVLQMMTPAAGAPDGAQKTKKNNLRPV
jgi:hypothetical protein